MKSYPLPTLVFLLTCLLVGGVIPSPVSADTVEQLTLANGVEYSRLPGDSGATLTFWMGVGTQDDPPGQTGLAEITAQALLGGTPRHAKEGEVLEALGGVATSVHTAVGLGHSVIVLGGVTDVPAALTLMAEVFSQSTLPYTAVMDARSDLASRLTDLPLAEVLIAETHDLLDGAVGGQADVFGVVSIEQADVRSFHQKHYRAGSFQVVQQGGPALSELERAVKTSLGSWAASAGPSTRSGGETSDDEEVEVPCSAILGSASPRVAVAFDVSGTDAVPAAAALSLSLPSGEWQLRSAALTAPGDFSAPGGRLVALSGEGATHADYLDLIAGLERMKARGAGRRAILGLADKAVSSGDEAGLAFLETEALLKGEAAAVQPARTALATLRRSSLKNAAGSLLAGRRAVGFAASALEDSWGVECSVLDSRTDGAQRDEVGRERAAMARAVVDRAVMAHGGESFLKMDKITLVGHHDTISGTDVRRAARTRLDADYGSMTLRQESRHESKRAGTFIVNYGPGTCRAKGPKGEWLDYPTLPRMTYRNTFSRHPQPLLRRASAEGSQLALLAPAQVGERKVNRVVHAHPEVGLTKMFFDVESGLLVRVEYRNRFPYQSTPIDVSIDYGDHVEVGGALLHGSETVGGPDTSLASRISEIEWTVRGEGFSPLDVLPHADDLGKTQSLGPAGAR